MSWFTSTGLIVGKIFKNTSLESSPSCLSARSLITYLRAWTRTLTQLKQIGCLTGIVYCPVAALTRWLCDPGLHGHFPSWNHDLHMSVGGPSSWRHSLLLFSSPGCPRQGTQLTLTDLGEVAHLFYSLWKLRLHMLETSQTSLYTWCMFCWFYPFAHPWQ